MTVSSNLKRAALGLWPGEAWEGRPASRHQQEFPESPGAWGPRPTAPAGTSWLVSTALRHPLRRPGPVRGPLQQAGRQANTLFYFRTVRTPAGSLVTEVSGTPSCQLSGEITS